jgi:hypothetical protein
MSSTIKASRDTSRSTGAPLPKGTAIMQRNLSNIALALIVAAAFGTIFSTQSFADWNPNNPFDQAKAKWVQLPDLNPTGMDVLDTLQPNAPVPPGPQWKTLADDFMCTQSGPIIDAHIWGSWLNNALPINSAGLPDPGSMQFKVSFWSDMQPNAAIPYSHPDNQLWTSTFQPGQFQVNPNVIPAQEQFYDPNLGAVIGTDNAVYQYNFPNLVDALGARFIQNQGTIYWLEVQAEVFTQPGTTATFGWKTADPTSLPFTYVPPAQYSFMDDAVFADTAGFNGPNTTFWRDMRYPAGHQFGGQSLDLSFVLTVPEPSSIVMTGLGLVAVMGLAYRRRRNLDN